MRPTLRRTREFALVYEQGRKRTCAALVVFHLSSAPDARIGFVASRKVGGAVQRNRAKRLLRAAFSQVEPELRDAGGWIVLVARRDIVELKCQHVADQLRAAFAGAAGGS